MSIERDDLLVLGGRVVFIPNGYVTGWAEPSLGLAGLCFWGIIMFYSLNWSAIYVHFKA